MSALATSVLGGKAESEAVAQRAADIMNSFRKHDARIRMMAAAEDPMHACEELEGYASAHGKDDFYEQLSALMAGCGLAPAALSDALAPLADSARVETDQSDQQIEGPSSVAANTPASLADSVSAAGNVPALCAGEQSMCLTSVAGNAPTSLAGSASAAGSVPVFPFNSRDRLGTWSQESC